MKKIIFFILLIISASALMLSCKNGQENTIYINPSSKTNSQKIDDWTNSNNKENAIAAEINVTIAQNAQNAIGSSSGQSTIGSTWFTDCDNEVDSKGKLIKDDKGNNINDGIIFRNIISTYDTWYKKNKKANPCEHPSATDAVKNDMLNKFGKYSIYTSYQKGLIVGQIMNQYKSLNCTGRGTVKLPINDKETLVFLAIKKTCYEWLHNIATSSGGKAITTSKKGDNKITNVSDYKKGMALYKKDDTHCAIIIAIVLNADKTVKYITVAESNWGTGWEINPKGQIPWSRTINERTTGYKEGGKQKGDSSFKLSDYDVIKIY